MNLPQIQCYPTPRLWIPGKRKDPFFNRRAAITAALTAGQYKHVVVNGGTLGPDASAVTAGLTSGLYQPVVVDAGRASDDAAALTAALTAGQYKLVVVDGGSIGPDTAALSAALTAGEYKFVIVATTAPAEAGTTTAALTSGTYALA